MMNEEVIVYLSETYELEMYKTLIFAGSAGFLGGVLNCTVQRYFARITNNQATSFTKLAIQYIANGLLFGLGTVVLVYSFFTSYSIESIKMIKTINQFSIPLGILFPPMLTIITEVINKNIFRRNED
jgi:hypothetical protein